ncbi:MAG: reactive intermediate/imine deaminase [Clostridia bacterium]|jgi:2-iminobutanoate/2-iminopropanoate deaminase|nr:reactive intermediate/imine deaminase [Clostridia bacterium]
MKKCFLTQNGPRAIGPYSTAVIHGDTCYLSGVIPVVPATGKLAEGGAEEQARQVFENMKTILAELNSSMADVLKTTVFLQDLGTFAAVNAIYAEYFGPDYPARSCVEVAKLPMGALVEVEAIVKM